MKISLKGYGENSATFKFTSPVGLGQPVAMEDNFTVKPCDAGDNFIGATVNARGEYANVQLSGYTVFTYTGTAPVVGVCTLAADGMGGVCLSDTGRQFVVTDVDTVNSTLGIIL